MSSIFHILKKELKLYLLTPISVVIIPAYTALSSFFLYSGILDYLRLTHSPTYQVKGLRAWNFIFPGFFSNIFIMLSLMIPLLTMRLVAEERRQHTHELLMSLPLSPFQYIFGKYLAALGFAAVLLVISLIAPLVLSSYINIPWGALAVAYLGLFLFIIFYIAVGTFFSTLTSNQFIACIATIGFSFSFIIVSWLAYISPPEVEKILGALLIFQHLESFFRGYIYVSDVTLFLSGAVLFIYLAQRKVFVEYPTSV